SYALGVLAGLRGDGWNLGFVVETERQVEAHLDEHLESLPEGDQRSREILRQMKIDEARHADNAEQAGARVLPPPIPGLMAAASQFMKPVAYRLYPGARRTRRRRPPRPPGAAAGATGRLHRGPDRGAAAGRAPPARRSVDQVPAVV